MHTHNVISKGVSLQQASKAVILLHGRGAPAEDILGLADFFDDGTTYFAAPQASNFSWYPYSFLSPRDQNQPWLDSAIVYIETVLGNIEMTLPPEKIYIMGFSQGACLSAEVTARNARRYGGIAILTGGLIGETIENKYYKGNFMSTPVYISNSDNDPHIPLERTNDTADFFKNAGADVLKEIFPERAHTVGPEEIDKVKMWLPGLFNL
jgi:phospholipase/carboxylesterase